MFLREISSKGDTGLCFFIEILEISDFEIMRE